MLTMVKLQYAIQKIYPTVRTTYINSCKNIHHTQTILIVAHCSNHRWCLVIIEYNHDIRRYKKQKIKINSKGSLHSRIDLPISYIK